ncbi:MAG: hypothetical protein ACYC9P_03015 [Rudaea sp.]
MSLYQVLFLVTGDPDADSQVDYPVQVQATDEAGAIELARAQLQIRNPHLDVAKLQVYSVWKMDE